MNRDLLVCLTIVGCLVFLLTACDNSPLPRDVQMPQVLSGEHDDKGPEDRYNFPYEPVSYNQEIEVPLPGLYYCFKMTDWAI